MVQSIHFVRHFFSICFSVCMRNNNRNVNYFLLRLSTERSKNKSAVSIFWFITKCIEQRNVMECAPFCEAETHNEINQFIYHFDLSNVLCEPCRLSSFAPISIGWRSPFAHSHGNRRSASPLFAQINGKSLIVERKIIYLQEYEICRRQTYWHIASCNAPKMYWIVGREL